MPVMQVEIGLLGGFTLHVDGRPVAATAWRRRNAAALVKVLALQPGRRMLRDRLIDVLWPDLTVEVAAPRLHKAAHYARAAIGVQDAVVLVDEQVRLLPSAEVTVDVEVFDKAADVALSGEADDALLAAAIDAYRGDLLPDDLYEPWSEEPREVRRLRYQHLLRAARRWEELAGFRQEH
jgi:DNA-binding SARP family transcriptional activator